MRNDKLERALNLCDLIQFEKPLMALISIATQLRLSKLSEKMDQILVRVVFVLISLFEAK